MSISIIKKTLFLRLFSVLFLFISVVHLAAQTNSTDSLLRILQSTAIDTQKVNIFALISNKYKNIDPEKAMFYAMEGFRLAEKLNYKKGIATNGNIIGTINKNKSRWDMAMRYYSISLKKAQEANELKLTGIIYNNIGEIYREQGIYDKAVTNYVKSMQVRDLQDDKDGISECYNNLGATHMAQGNYTKAIEYYNNSLKICEDLKNKKGIASSFNNIGINYAYQKEYDKAIDFFTKALNVNEELKDKKGITDCYNNLGLIYNMQDNFNKAIEYYTKSLKISEELNDKNSISRTLGNISSYKIALKKYNEAYDLAQKSLTIAKEIGSLENESSSYELLSMICDSLGKTKDAFIYYKFFIAIKDSMFNETKHKQLSEMESKYEGEKKQKEIALLEKDKDLQKSEIKRQTSQKYALLGGLFFMLILASVILFSYKKIKTQKHVIENKNIVLGQQNEEIRTQRDEIETQRDLVTRQKEHIEEIYEEISDSINYAKRIQQAVLPTGDYANNILGNYFILFKPKDVVSGDFYWATKVNEYLIVTVADCTGHGVPGAFMSMLGISFLNEIVRKKEVTQASQVLDHLRNSIIDALKQSGQSGEQKDGMDISLMVLNMDTLECQFAGANNPLWISINCDSVDYSNNLKIEKTPTTEKNNLISTTTKGIPPNQSSVVNLNRSLQYYDLIELKPDKMPVAIYDNMKPFSNHIINLCKGDTIYLASDGFEDQFGGPKNKKFLSKNMKELLRSNSHKAMAEQKELLEIALNDWKGGNEQIDDITVMGIKI